MAENQVTIEIIAEIDKAIEGMEKVKKGLTDTADTASKASTKTESSILKQIKNLQALGNIAVGVSNMFQAYENMQMRLENAQDRVTNSTISYQKALQNVADAQRKLDSITKESKEVDDQLVASKKETLQWLNTYLQLKNREGASTASIGAAYNEYQKSQERTTQLEEESAKLKEQKISAEQSLKEQMDGLTVATNNLEIATRRLEKAQGDIWQGWLSIGVNALSTIISLATLIGNVFGGAAILGALTTVGEVIVGIGAAIAALPAAVIAIAIAIGLLIAAFITNFAHVRDIFIEWWSLLWDSTVTAFKTVIDAVRLIIASIIAIFTGDWEEASKIFEGIINRWKEWWTGLWDHIKKIIDFAKKGLQDVMNLFGIGKDKGSMAQGKPTGTKTTKVTDFVMRPGQAPVSIHPNDTLVGFKGAPPNMGGGGTTVNITNMYASNPREFADALQNMLSNKITI